MAHVPMPDAAMVEIVGRGFVLPQSVLEAPSTASRQTLALGYGRWHGLARVSAKDDAGDIAVRNWLSRMGKGNNWTDIPIGKDRTLPDGVRPRVVSVSPTGGVLTITGDPDSTTLAGIWLSDGKRLRVIGIASRQAANRFEVSLWPDAPQLTPGSVLDEVTTIRAYQRIEENDQSATPIAEMNVDWMEPVDMLWIERVTP